MTRHVEHHKSLQPGLFDQDEPSIALASSCEPLEAATGVANAAPNYRSHLKVAHHCHRFNWSRCLSCASWFLIYSRITSSFRPTVDTK